MIFAFWALSLVAAGITEWIANLAKKRSDDLVRGIRVLLGEEPDTGWPASTEDRDPAAAAPKSGGDTAAASGSAAGMASRVLSHPILGAMSQPPSRWGKGKPPSYVPARAFARALLDTLAPAHGEATNLTTLRAEIGKLPEAASRPLLLLVTEAGDDVDQLRRSIEEWFDDQMDRVSGWYKRWAKRVLLVVGLFVAVSLNADTIRMATTLYRDPAVRAAAVAQAEAACRDKPSATCTDAGKENLGKIGLPLGWSCPDDKGQRNWKHCLDQSAGQTLLRVLGWLLTAMALSLGAPFWFDALNRVSSLRKTGPKPAPADTAES